MGPQRQDWSPDDLPREAGAYVLVIELDLPLRLAIGTLPSTVLRAGRYAYCGSAYGNGGLAGRIGRHLKRDKTLRWHVDHLTSAGTVAGLGLDPGGSECTLLARLMAVASVVVPVKGFGSSDCRRCPSHLVQVPATLDLRSIVPAYNSVLSAEAATSGPAGDALRLSRQKIGP